MRNAFRGKLASGLASWGGGCHVLDKRFRSTRDTKITCSLLCWTIGTTLILTLPCFLHTLMSEPRYNTSIVHQDGGYPIPQNNLSCCCRPRHSSVLLLSPTSQAMYQMLEENFVGLIFSVFNEDTSSKACKVQVIEASPPAHATSFTHCTKYIQHPLRNLHPPLNPTDSNHLKPPRTTF